MKKSKVINFSIIIAVMIAIGFAGYFYYTLYKFDNTEKDLKEKEASSLLEVLSTHYLFPIGENPTIATVSDPEALKTGSPFVDALKGDKVFIFSGIGKAILYRPSIDRIIDITGVEK